MKKYELDATYDNLINTLKSDAIGRNSELVSLLMILDDIEGSVSISLDANWGNGKTFFVKQLELILNNHRDKVFNNTIDTKLDQIIINNSHLKEIELSNTYIPIYYDSWLYDDHKDPLLSLIFSIIEDGLIKSNSVEISNKKEKALSVASSIVSLTGCNIDLVKLAEKPNTYLDLIYSVEEIKKLLKSIFDEIITEHSQKLIIIIDELDRCRPDYAVNLLEKIKHFFDDDRVIFLFSTNKEQITHTIKKFYGYHFDATSYLNRFFDFQFILSDIDSGRYLNYIDVYRNSSEYLQMIAQEIGQFYGFSIREYNTYYQKIKKIHEFIKGKSISGLVFSFQVFSPVIWALSLKNTEMERKFKSGELSSELEKVLMQTETIKRYALRFISHKGTDDEKIQLVLNLYSFMFREKSLREFSTDSFDMYDEQRIIFFNKINMM